MNKQDEYHFFLQKAIGEPLHSNRKYFFNQELSKLLSLYHNEGVWTPHYRNRHVIPSLEKATFFELMIKQLTMNDSSIIESNINGGEEVVPASFY